MAKFTTKQHRPTGPYASFDHIYVDLKYGGKVCGKIEQLFQEWRVGLMIINDEEHCSWQWAYLKRRFESIKAAKEWLNENQVQIFRQFRLHFDEE